MAVAKKISDPIADLRAKAQKKWDLLVGPMDTILEEAKFLTTGNIALDYIMGGGIPLGRTVELHGPPGSGKSTTAIQTSVELQKVIIAGGDPERGIGPNDVILWEDFESAMDKEYAISLGLDVNHPSFQYVGASALEDGADLANEFIKTGLARLIVVDSVAGMNPSAKAEAESVGTNLPGLTSRLLKQWGVQLLDLLKEYNASVIFLNHEIDKFDMGGAKRGMPTPTTTPGGIALKFFASTRVQYRPGEKQMGTVMDPVTNEMVSQPVSTTVRVKVIKNRVAPPFRVATVRVRFGRGFDNFWTAMQILISNKKVVYASPFYKFHNVEEIGLAPKEWMPRLSTGAQAPAINGEKRLLKAADAYPEWRAAVIAYAEQIVRDNIDLLKAVAPKEVEEEDDDDEEETSDKDPRRVDF